jgi:hypothetical protein
MTDDTLRERSRRTLDSAHANYEADPSLANPGPKCIATNSPGVA